MTAYIVDVETSDRDNPEVIEIAWVRFPVVVDLAGPCDEIPPMTGATELSSHVTRFRPEGPMSFGAIAVHHILPSELEGWPPSSEAKLPDDCTYMIGHSIDYDWGALGKPNVKRICTRAMAEHVWPEAGSYSQSALVYMLLGANPKTREYLRNAHSALTDVHNNLRLLIAILKQKPEITTWAQLWEFSEECRIPLRMPITKARGEKLTDIEDGLLNWCLNQYWLPVEHPYLYKGLVREHERREEAWRQRTGPLSVYDDSGPDDEVPF